MIIVTDLHLHLLYSIYLAEKLLLNIFKIYK